MSTLTQPANSLDGRSVPEQDASPPRIPDYELLRRIGRGSYGEVWLGRSVTGAYRAVKVIYRKTFEQDRPYEREFRGIQRFEPVSRTHESQMDVLHVGRNDPDGYFYYAMELADDERTGQEIDPEKYSPKSLKSELNRSGRLPFTESIELGVKLATALEHLHRHGLVHRDIKPSNIIFVSGSPKLADIGLVTAQDETMSFVSTIGYFPPEGPGTRQADLYSLGKVLYEASTGKDRQQFPDPATELSTDADTAAHAELNEVVLKACAPRARERYQKATEMKADLLLLQGGKSVKRMRKLERNFARLKRVGLATAIVAALAISAFFYEHRQSQRMHWLADESRDRLVHLYVSHGVDRMDTGDYLRSLVWFAKALELNQNDPARASIDRIRIEAVRRQCPKLVAFGIHQGAILHAEFSTDGQRIVTASEDGTARVWDAATSEPVSPPLKHDGAVRRAVFSRDGRRIATASDDFSAKVWDSATGMLICGPLTHASNVVCVAFSPDGTRIVTASWDQRASVWDSETGKEIVPPLKHKGMIDRATFSPDGKLVATTSRDHTARIWNAETGEAIAPPLRHDDDVNQAVFSPDGRRIATVSDDGTARVWDVGTGRPITPSLRERGRVQTAIFSPDGQRLVTAGGLAGSVGVAEVWNANTGEFIAAIPPQENPIFTAQFSPDGRWILLDGAGGAARAWDAQSGEPVTPGLRHTLAVTSARFANDGRRVLIASRDGTWRIWDLADDEILSPSAEFPHNILHAEFDPSGKVVLAEERTSPLITEPVVTDAYLLDVSSLERVGLSAKHLTSISHAEFSPDGRFILTASGDLTARVWNAADGRPISPILRDAPGVIDATFSKAGDVIVTTTGGQTGSTARVWHTGTWTASTPALAHEQPILSVAISPDGTRVATATGWLEHEKYGEARIWNGRTGAMTLPPFKHDGPVVCVRFSPDGRRLVTAWAPPGEAAGGAEVWDIETGRHLHSLPHADGVQDAEFSPDGGQVVTASQDRTARIWNALTGKPIGQVLRHKRTVFRAQFSRNGRRVVTGSHDGTVRVWDASTGEPVTPPLHCGGMVWSAAFSPDGQKIVSGSGEWESTGQLHVWEIPEIHYSLNDISQLAQLQSGNSIDSAGAEISLSTQQLLNSWQTLKMKHPEDFSAPSPVIQAWHHAQAAQCRNSRQWPAAIFHLEQCLKLKPGDKRLLAEYTEARAQLMGDNHSGALPP
jgi:WD40 repeat protein